MLAYAAHKRPRNQVRPGTLAVIVGGHVAVIAGLMLLGGPIVERFVPQGTDVVFIDPPEPPPLPEPEIVKEPKPAPAPSVYLPDTVVQLPPKDVPLIATVPDFPPKLPVTYTANKPVETVVLAPVTRTEAKLDTPDRLLEPPYPAAKQNAGEEARLRLTLSIDKRGKVVAVEPVGAADPAFLASARKHLLRYWRYTPATEGGVPVATTKTIWLTFTLR